MNKLLITLIIGIVITIIVFGISAYKKTETVVSDVKAMLTPETINKIGEIGKLAKDINSTNLVLDVKTSVTELNKIVKDINDGNFILNATNALGIVSKVNITELNSIIQNCGDGITMNIKKGQLVTNSLVTVPTEDLTLKLNFPGCNGKENFTHKNMFRKNRCHCRRF